MPNYLYDENDVLNKKVTDHVIKFMIDNKIDCEETVHQCDWVIENAYDFIEELFKLVETKLPIDDEI